MKLLAALCSSPNSKLHYDVLNHSDKGLGHRQSEPSMSLHTILGTTQAQSKTSGSGWLPTRTLVSSKGAGAAVSPPRDGLKTAATEADAELPASLHRQWRRSAFCVVCSKVYRKPVACSADEFREHFVLHPPLSPLTVYASWKPCSHQMIDCRGGALHASQPSHTTRLQQYDGKLWGCRTLQGFIATPGGA